MPVVSYLTRYVEVSITPVLFRVFTDIFNVPLKMVVAGRGMSEADYAEFVRAYSRFNRTYCDQFLGCCPNGQICEQGFRSTQVNTIPFTASTTTFRTTPSSTSIVSTTLFPTTFTTPSFATSASQLGVTRYQLFIASS
jgi:hypothetical protein